MSWLGHVLPFRLKRSSTTLAAQGAQLEALAQQILAEVRDLRAAWEREAEQRAAEAARHWQLKGELAALKEILERLSGVLERSEVRAQARRMLGNQGGEGPAPPSPSSDA